MMASHQNTIYKRFETDRELRKRLLDTLSDPAKRMIVSTLYGLALDLAAEEAGLQRRLIEVVPD
jgi:hypothetical protein